MGPKDKKFLKGGWGVKPIRKNRRWILNPIERAYRKTKGMTAVELGNAILGYRDAENRVQYEIVEMRRNAMMTGHFSSYPGTAPENDLLHISQGYAESADYQDQILQSIQIQRKAYERRFAEISPKP